MSLVNLQPLFERPKLITKAKYNDLLALFTMNPPALSKEYRPFYETLPKLKDEIASDDE